eukprot:c29330_g1_i2 orf=639-3632(-)
MTGDDSSDSCNLFEKETSMQLSKGKRNWKTMEDSGQTKMPSCCSPGKGYISDQILSVDSDEDFKLESTECSTSDDSEFSTNPQPKRSRISISLRNKKKNLGKKCKGRSGAGARGRRKQRQKKKVIRGDLDWEVWEKELENWELWGADGDELDADAIVQSKKPVDAREPPPELLMPLLPFQKEWLGWSLKQENSQTKGGILADEMGMGKTIQAISLILLSRALRETDCSPVLAQANVSSNSPVLPVERSLLKLDHTVSTNPCQELLQVKATLVVCPLIAVIQWRNEIARFTKEGSVKVLVYHGAKRCRDLSELAEYDIVLTTYAIVEHEHRVNVRPAKEACKWCGKLYYPDKMALHLRFFCGPTAQKSEKLAKQVKKRAPRMLKRTLGKSNLSEYMDTELHVGKSKKRMKGEVAATGQDYVGNGIHLSQVSASGKKSKLEGKDGDLALDKQLHNSVESENKTVLRRGRKKIDSEDLKSSLHEALESIQEETTTPSSSGLSLLHAVKWDRVILDEAHSIKDRRCSTAKAVFALKSDFKWALSGTPLQNRVGELYSLVRFLEIEPFSYYFCRLCDCKSLDYSFGIEWRMCDHCKHSPLHHFCWWNKYIANPIKRYGYVNEGRKAMLLLKHKLLDSTLLRRTKIERAADLALPPRTTYLRRDTFDTREDDFYQALYTQSQSQFNTYIAARTLLNNYAHIFDLLTRLRQAVDHPYLVVYSGTGPSVPNQDPYDPLSMEGVCGVCKDPAEDAVTTACRHTFCKVCVQEYISVTGQLGSGQSVPCPLCQKPLTVDLVGSSKDNTRTDSIYKVKGYKRSGILNRISLNDFQTSTKIDALREEVMFMLQKDAAAKAIVFSQFTSFLDLIGFCMEKSGIHCVKLDGSMNIVARDQMIEKFTNDADCKVFLMSLKAGGVALNLTVASHVFLMDPWWNPAVEQQAQDRIHRLGQYKPIRVVRFVIENTIEERILRLQEKKQLVFEGTVGGSAEALGRLTEEDLRFLFSS